ncbi:MAG: hypothetical protein ACK47B_03240 [Armatimonadota bacterium]
MNRFSRMTRRMVLAGALAATAALGGAALSPALAHEAKCPVCKLDVVQDTDKLDNEVALKSGRKRIEYRCVYCALQDAKSYPGDITVLAPSELKGKPVTLTRKEGKWTASPETAVFVGHKVNHRQCELGYRALTTKEAFPKWVQANQALLKDAKPLTLAELLELASPAK